MKCILEEVHGWRQYLKIMSHDVSPDWITAIVTDNGANIVKA